MRLFLALGPGDIVQEERRHLALEQADGGERRGETSLTFSHQLVRMLQMRGYEALLVSSNPRADRLEVGGITLVNLPRPLAAGSGLGFIRGHVTYGLRLADAARQYGADLAIVDSGTTYPFALWRFRHYGIRVAMNLHNVRWAQGFEPTKPVARLFRTLDSHFLRSGAFAAAGCSPACAEQIRVDGADATPYFGWTAQYNPLGFVTTPEIPSRPGGPVRLLFAGRIERNKGVFDLIPIARGLRKRGLGDARIVVCGDGSVLAELREAVSASDVADMIEIRGRLERDGLLAAYAHADLVIVPTRSDFTEGMPLVCAEAMLSYRPVLTSRVSNALPVLGDAVLEATPNEPDSYVDAIVRFAQDPALRDRLSTATFGVREQFLDRKRSYGAALDAMIQLGMGTTLPPLDYAALFAG